MKGRWSGTQEDEEILLQESRPLTMSSEGKEIYLLA